MRSEELSETTRPVRPLPPGPRHMRKRRFRREIPDQLLPGGSVVAEPVSAAIPLVRRDSPYGLAAKKASPRTKRRLALSLVILVSASVLILALSLIFVR